METVAQCTESTDRNKADIQDDNQIIRPPTKTRYSSLLPLSSESARKFLAPISSRLSIMFQSSNNNVEISKENVKDAVSCNLHIPGSTNRNNSEKKTEYTGPSDNYDDYENQFTMSLTRRHRNDSDEEVGSEKKENLGVLHTPKLMLENRNNKTRLAGVVQNKIESIIGTKNTNSTKPRINQLALGNIKSTSTQNSNLGLKLSRIYEKKEEQYSSEAMRNTSDPMQKSKLSESSPHESIFLKNKQN